MQVNRGKLQILTVAAMLVLVSGGIAAYAEGQYAASAGAPAAVSPPAALAGSDTNSTSTNSTSSTTSTTSTANQTLCQPTKPVKVGRLVLPITATGGSTSVGSSVSFSNGRGCVASITTVGGIFNVQILLRFAKPVTQYNVVLVANGTSYTLGNLVTGPAGSGQIDNQVLLTTGTYVVSIRIYDTSSSPGQSTLVLSTGQGTITSAPFPTSGANDTNSTNGGQPPFPGGQQGGQGGPGGQGGQGGPGGQGGQGGPGQSGHHK